jgi:hypothetical protein
MRFRIERMKKIARSLGEHRELILNNFRCLELALHHSRQVARAGIDPRILLTNQFRTAT